MQGMAVALMRYQREIKRMVLGDQILRWVLLIVLAILSAMLLFGRIEMPFYDDFLLRSQGNTYSPEVSSKDNKMPIMRPDSPALPAGAKTKSKYPVAQPAVPAQVPTSQWTPPAPPAKPATIPFPSSYGERVPTRSTSVGTTSTGTVAPTPPPRMTDEEWLAQDAQFLDTKSQLKRDYDNLVAQLSRQRGDYELDTSQALRNLGWEGEGWNQNDKLTGYGLAYQNQLGDFASRGLLDSSLYGESLNDLNRGFQRQKSDIDTALSQFLRGQAQEKSQAKGNMEAALVAAQRQALSRMAAQLGL